MQNVEGSSPFSRLEKAGNAGLLSAPTRLEGGHVPKPCPKRRCSAMRTRGKAWFGPADYESGFAGLLALASRAHVDFDRVRCPSIGRVGNTQGTRRRSPERHSGAGARRPPPLSSSSSKPLHRSRGFRLGGRGLRGEDGLLRGSDEAGDQLRATCGLGGEVDLVELCVEDGDVDDVRSAVVLRGR
jgi:hypothetical protein